jgi:hypothetical protein
VAEAAGVPGRAHLGHAHQGAQPRVTQGVHALERPSQLLGLAVQPRAEGLQVALSHQLVGDG